jgi:hypothetical protein
MAKKKDFYSRYVSVAGIDSLRRDLAEKRDRLLAELRDIDAQVAILAKVRAQNPDSGAQMNGRHADESSDSPKEHGPSRRVGKPTPAKTKGEPSHGRSKRHVTNEGPSVNQLIMSYVAEHPGGQTHSAVVDHVLAHKTTKAKDPRSMVFSYISALKRAGYLVADGNNHLVHGKKPWVSREP